MRTVDHVEIVLEEYFVKYGVQLLYVQLQGLDMQHAYLLYRYVLLYVQLQGLDMHYADLFHLFLYAARRATTIHLRPDTDSKV